MPPASVDSKKKQYEKKSGRRRRQKTNPYGLWGGSLGRGYAPKEVG